MLLKFFALLALALAGGLIVIVYCIPHQHDNGAAAYHADLQAEIDQMRAALKLPPAKP